VLELGTFVAEASPLTYYNPVPDSHSATFTAFQQADSLNNFAFQPIGIINDLVVSIAPKTGFRPNFVAQYIINYQNIGTTALLPTIELNLDPVLAYYEASITPTIVNPNSVSWELPELGPLTEGNIIVLVNVSQNAMNGSIVHSSVTIEPVIGDADVINNTAVWPVVVTGSYDPNDIQVDRIALALDELATPPDLNYLIRFQNTGTDTAFTVRVDDVLPPGLQFSSFQFVGSSHPMEIAYENSSNKLSFQFNNILLPDSNTNEAASHGYVWYRIKPVTTLVLGDSILNQAAIFFDFNEPVITNTAFTVIEAPNAISTVATPASFSVFPNPAKGSLIVTTAQIQRGTTLTLTDAFGREVLNERMNSTTHTLAVGELPRGVYMVTLRSGTSKEAQRVVLE